MFCIALFFLFLYKFFSSLIALNFFLGTIYIHGLASRCAPVRSLLEHETQKSATGAAQPNTLPFLITYNGFLFLLTTTLFQGKRPDHDCLLASLAFHPFGWSGRCCCTPQVFQVPEVRLVSATEYRCGAGGGGIFCGSMAMG